jgi:hypothetical protein
VQLYRKLIIFHFDITFCNIADETKKKLFIRPCSSYYSGRLLPTVQISLYFEITRARLLLYIRDPPNPKEITIICTTVGQFIYTLLLLCYNNM